MKDALPSSGSTPSADPAPAAPAENASLPAAPAKGLKGRARAALAALGMKGKKIRITKDTFKPSTIKRAFNKAARGTRLVGPVLKDTFNDVRSNKRELGIMLGMVLTPIPGMTTSFFLYRLAKYRKKQAAANDNAPAPAQMNNAQPPAQIPAAVPSTPAFSATTDQAPAAQAPTPPAARKKKFLGLFNRR